MRRQIQHHDSHTNNDGSDDDIPLSSNTCQVLDRVHSDRLLATNPSEDRRRRTIIVEKRNGSFGFTLQSYGIHYRREKEIEMITYVDYVDYDGPAYRAGMREGDVILSINGTDMERADHKALVNYIKSCEVRMRMVVLFENCVRKVELHMKYIQLQQILHAKMSELEKLCVRERALLEGKWKTHSLPARKKSSKPSGASTAGGNSETQHTNDVATMHAAYPYYRTTASTEDVASNSRYSQQYHHQPHRVDGADGVPPKGFMVAQQQQPTLILAYHYLDPYTQHQGYCPTTAVMQPQTTNSSSSREYLLKYDQSSRCQLQDLQQHNFCIKTPQPHHKSSTKGGHVINSSHKDSGRSSGKKHSEVGSGTASHLCNPCIRSSNNGDNTSLDAYDLASPATCCNPHCGPTLRSSSRRHVSSRASTSKRDLKTEETQTDPIVQQQQQVAVMTPSRRSRPHSTASSQTQTMVATAAPATGGTTLKYFHLVSQCSLHSCTSSDLSTTSGAAGAQSAPGTVATGVEHSGATSYTTSLSTDTLFWDSVGQGHDGSANDIGNKQSSSLKSTRRLPEYWWCTSKRECNGGRHHGCSATDFDDHVFIESYQKPKSWDNLAAKTILSHANYGDPANSRSGSILVTAHKKCLPPSSSNATKIVQYVHTNSGEMCVNLMGANMYDRSKSSTTSQKSSESLFSSPSTATNSLSRTDSKKNSTGMDKQAVDVTSSVECLIRKGGGSSNSTSTVSNATTFPTRQSSMPAGFVQSPADPNFGYYSATTPRSQQTSTEATRL